MPEKGRIVFTTASGSVEEEIRLLGTDLRPIYHFNGLYYKLVGAGGGHKDKVYFYEDLSRLAKIVLEEGSTVVTLCAGCVYGNLPFTSIDIARFLLENTKVKTVICFTVVSTKDLLAHNIDIFKITARGITLLQSLRPSDHNLWNEIVRHTRSAKHAKRKKR